MTRKALGRGLGALIPEAPAPASPTASPDRPAVVVAAPQAGAPVDLPIASIAGNPYQPRHHFDAERLRELAESIRVSGVLQPVLVRHAPDGRGYQLIAGERRLKAAELAGRDTVPAVVRMASRKEMLEFALIENIQREDL